MTLGLLVLVFRALTLNLSPLKKGVAGMLGSTLGLAPPALGQEAGPILQQTAKGWAWIWAWIVGLGLTTALLRQLLYTIAAPRVGAARASAAGRFELPTMFALGWFALGEPLGARAAVASALVLIAIALSPAIRPAAQHEPPPPPNPA